MVCFLHSREQRSRRVQRGGRNAVRQPVHVRQQHLFLQVRVLLLLRPRRMLPRGLQRRLGDQVQVRLSLHARWTSVYMSGVRQTTCTYADDVCVRYRFRSDYVY